MRTLGNAIDTSFVDLKGGTTGQVLAKASNTDLDFTWATDASGIPATIFDAKGDLIAASAADTAARLASSGVNGDVLTVDTSTSTGLKWAAPAAGGMTVISTTTLSGSSVTLNSIPATYNTLYLVIRGYNPSTDATLSLRLNGDTNTRYQETTTNTSNDNSFGGNFYQLSDWQDSSVVTGLITVTIPDYANTSTWKFILSDALTVNDLTTTKFNWVHKYGFYNQTGAISSIVLYPASGTFDGGTAILYGVK
jgi:hypothetical protein